MASGINKNKTLPKFIVVILDDDLISHLDYCGAGVTEMFEKWISWLLRQFTELIKARKQQLPKKALVNYKLCMYWCNAPLHCGFTFAKNEIHKKYNTCLDLLCKDKQDVHVIKLKDWSFDNKSYVVGDKITETVMEAYWDAVDSAFEFNAHKCDVFTAKLMFNSLPKSGVKENSSERRPARAEDEIQQFFAKCRNDKYHWCCDGDVREDL